MRVNYCVIIKNHAVAQNIIITRDIIEQSSHLFPEGPVVCCGEVGLLRPFPQYCRWYEGCLDLVEYFIE